MVVTQSSVMDSEFWDLFENEGVTCFHGVPNTYEMLRHIELFEDDFPDLRTMSQAGGKLSRELQEYYGRYAEKTGNGSSSCTGKARRQPPFRVLSRRTCFETRIRRAGDSGRKRLP